MLPYLTTMLGMLYLLQTQSNLLMVLNIRLMLFYSIGGLAGGVAILYLVSFISYDTSYNEWLFAANLANFPDILRYYQTAHGLA